MSFKNIKDILSRDEMKNIMAGSGAGCTIFLAYGNIAYSYSGGCSGSSVSACAGYANQICQGYVSNGYSACSYQCG